MNRRQAKKAESKYWMTKEEEFQLWYWLQVPRNPYQLPHKRWRQWLKSFWKRQEAELGKWKYPDIQSEVRFRVINGTVAVPIKEEDIDGKQIHTKDSH